MSTRHHLAPGADDLELIDLRRNWPDLRDLLSPMAKRISLLYLNATAQGHKAIVRFTNDYGLEIMRHPDDDFFEMTVIKFRGFGYGFTFDTAIPDLNIGYRNADIVELCEQVSQLK